MAAMSSVMLTETSSALGRLYADATRYFIEEISPAAHAAAYVGEHGSGFAETEFAGKYMDVCVRYARTTGSGRALEAARTVARAVSANQRADGYIGGMERGRETDDFSIWNQAFTLLGLTSFYEYTHEAFALTAAEKMVRWCADRFMSGKADILAGANNGSQHLSFLLPLVRLCRVSDEPRCRDLARYIVGRIKGSDNDFFHFDSILDLRSKKGIETFVILSGILEYGELFGDAEALPACQKYWTELSETQIRENGNGTNGEVWEKDGGRPQMLPVERLPDENCVAVGWIEFCLALYFRTGEAKYLDAADQSIYNHLLGAVGEAGEDFAYYQPNFGRRITHTGRTMYQCCRYRGYTAVSILPQALFRAAGDVLDTVLYADARYEDEAWTVWEQTAFPYEGSVTLRIAVKRPGRRTLRLRVPSWAQQPSLTLDGAAVGQTPTDGWLTLDRAWTAGEHTVFLCFAPRLSVRRAVIDGEARACVLYGCVLLAAVTDGPAPDGAWQSLCFDADAPLTRTDAGPARIAFTAANGTRFTDLASSGRNGGEFVVWARDTGEGHRD